MSDDDRLIPITIKHSDLVEFARTAAAVIDNPARPDWMRADAQEFYDQLSHCILYENVEASPVALVEFQCPQLLPRHGVRGAGPAA